MTRWLWWIVAMAGAALAMIVPDRHAMAACVALAYLGFCVAIVGAHRRRRAARTVLASPDDATRPTLVAYASQTGFAEQLALQTARALQGAGMPVQLLSFAELDGARLAGCDQALFVVSTTV